MFPYGVLEDWFGAPFEADLPKAIGRLTADQAAQLAGFIYSKAHGQATTSRATRPGELRPNVTTLRVLDTFWGAGSLMDRSCAVLTYSHAATAMDPFSFTVAEWASASEDYTDQLPALLARAAKILATLHPLVVSGALDLLPPEFTRDHAEEIPAPEIDPDLMQRYSDSGLSARIGDFNRNLGARHVSGRYNGYRHLWEIYQDLTLVERYPHILQPLFVAGFDAELANLLMPITSSSPTRPHLEALAAFRFPTHQMTPARVAELRAIDEFQAWRQGLQLALSGTDPKICGVAEAQGYVYETMRPIAERIVKSFQSQAWRTFRHTGVQNLVLGACSGVATTAVGGSPAESFAGGLAGAAVGAAWGAAQSRGHRTTIDVPFLRMTPEHPWTPPVAIPTMGIL